MKLVTVSSTEATGSAFGRGHSVNRYHAIQRGPAMGHLRNVSRCDLMSHATELVTADTHARIVGSYL